MPAKGKKKLTRAAEQRIVQSRLAGKTVREVAADEGVAPQTVSAVAKRNSALIQQLTDEHELKLRSIYATALDRLEEDLKSDSAAVRHDARVVALKYVTAADRLKAAASESAGDVSLAEVLVVYGRLMHQS